MTNSKPTFSVILAALILGGAVLGGSVVIQRSVDRTGTQLGEVLSALAEAKPAKPALAAAPRPGRPDPAQRYTLTTDGAPRKGAETASIQVVEFSDFQCPFCARVVPTVARIEEEYGDRVAIVFKHLPLKMHGKAPAAHAAAEAAHLQGKFWEMHDLIFANQREMNDATYRGYAQQLGLDIERFDREVASALVKQRVEADTAEAARLGVTGTPSFFVNGRYLSGAQPFESFQRIIEAELKQAG